MNPPNNKLDVLDWASVGLAAVTAVAGTARVFGGDELFKRIDGTTLTYFGVAGALLLLRKVKSLSFGDYKLELKDLEAKADEALEEAKTASSMAQHLAPASSQVQPATASTVAALVGAAPAVASTEKVKKAADLWNRSPGTAEDDPWKRVFGEKAESNYRRLRAQVAESSGDTDWFRIRLWVESTDPEHHPLAGRVRFFIHDTFSNDKPFVPVVGGRAELRLHAYGAFTVGALADDGKTELELDLAQDRSFPKRFREH